MTDRLGFILWPALAIFTGCALARPVDVALAGQPPERLTGDIVTLVEWKSAEAVGIRCAQLQARFGQFPTGAHGCAYAEAGGPITLVLPMDLHPLISHELGHAHQLAKGEPVNHKGWG
jgi:hypothetical protein